MRKSRFSDERVIGVLKEHAAGVPVADIGRKHGITGHHCSSTGIRGRQECLS